MDIATIKAALSQGGSMEDARKIATGLLTERGITIPFHPSVDFVELLRQYKANPDLWKAALDYLEEIAPRLSEITEFGETELVGTRCFAILSELMPMPLAETTLEGHHDYIDIQLTEGPVRWGICPSDNGHLQVVQEYDPAKEAGFYLSKDTEYYTQEADTPYVFVFFPKDLHNPSFAAEGAVYEKPLKKLVIKVANAE